MFGLGHAPELILVLVIALIVLGPGKIPEVAQMLGRGIRELRQASADLQKTFDVNELVNPTPPPPPPPPPADPPPIEHTTAPVAAVSESIASPAMLDAAAKPKRTRKRTTVDSDGASPAGENGAKPAKPRASRRPSRKTTDPVSLDAAV